jgi:hypothetical protein
MVADPAAVTGRSGQPLAGYSAPGRRIRLMSERRRLAASLRSRAARLGRVARRGAGGGAVASVRMAASLLAAACRLRSWERCSEAVTVRTPPASLPDRARSARSLSTGGSADVAAKSKESSTRLSAVLTDCPPGPGDLEKRHDSSPGGITAPRMLTGYITRPGSGAGGWRPATGVCVHRGGVPSAPGAESGVCVPRGRRPVRPGRESGPVPSCHVPSRTLAQPPARLCPRRAVHRIGAPVPDGHGDAAWQGGSRAGSASLAANFSYAARWR